MHYNRIVFVVFIMAVLIIGVAYFKKTSTVKVWDTSESATEKTEDVTPMDPNVNISDTKGKQPGAANELTNNTMAETIPVYSQAVLKTNVGEVTVELFRDDAPKTVENFITLAQSGFYNGTKFHRVIEDFMIQGGDPLSKTDDKNMWGRGGPGYQFEDEINDHPLVRGSLAMANSGPDTNGSQFFIVTAESTPWLDGKHTNFGRVVEGMEVVEKIEKTARDASDRPLEDIIINEVELK